MPKYSFTYSRKIPVMLDGFRSVDFFCSITKEYSPEEVEEITLIETEELNELSELVDLAQRKIIRKETGEEFLMIDELQMINEEKKHKIKKKGK